MNTIRPKKHVTLEELKNLMQTKPQSKAKASPKAKPSPAPKAAAKTKMPAKTFFTEDPQKQANLAKEAQIQQEAAKRRQERYLEAKALLEFLCQTHPDCFNLKFRKPLKVGIDKDILLEHADKISNRAILTSALKIYTLNIRYWKGLLTQTHRVDLAGKVCGIVTEEQKAHAAAPYERAVALLPKQPNNRHNFKKAIKSKA